MNIENLFLPILGGSIAGIVFFSGLWWTVRDGLQSAHPEVWFLGSLVIRMAIAISAFILLSNGQWQRLGACLIGFLIARVVLLRLLTAPTAMHGSGKGCHTCG